jgi:hypothetical protein
MPSGSAGTPAPTIGQRQPCVQGEEDGLDGEGESATWREEGRAGGRYERRAAAQALEEEEHDAAMLCISRRPLPVFLGSWLAQ